ncbi:MAG: pseudouridine synthase [Paucimonas sp.]|nr:pseudouridine synthase [Paucimonas sp.]
MSGVGLPLPHRDGVAPSYVWLPHGPWTNLLAFLIERFPGVAEGRWRARMQAGEVRDASGMVFSADAPFPAGAQVFYYREIEAEPAIPFLETIVYQDEHLLVADKPHFLPVIPSGRFLRETLLVRLRQRTRCEALAPIHRLDRETAGLVAFSVNPDTRGRYQALFRERQVEKVYEAIARPAPRLIFPLRRQTRIVRGKRFFVMEEEPGEPNATTIVDVLEKGPLAWRYRLQPISGKTHQLRLHMLGLGAPILGDLLYPDIHPVGADDFNLPLQLLARTLAFEDPVTGVAHRFDSARKLLDLHSPALVPATTCPASSSACANASK